MPSLRRLRRFGSVFGGLSSGGAGSTPSFEPHDLESTASRANLNSSLVKPGDILGGRFKIVALLGEGGMGSVYAAEDTVVRTAVAVKVIHPELVAATTMRLRLIREVRMARLVTHPNVCRVYDVGECQSEGKDILFLTMELLHGETLAERLSRRPRLTLQESKSLALQLSGAVGALHLAGIVHRDFKPGNVMLIEKDSGWHAVVMDFGLAHPLRPERGGDLLTQTGLIAGTPAYMAPEQAAGGLVTAASDVYALGIVIAEMITGLSIHSVMEKSAHGRRPSVAARAVLKGAGREWLSLVLRCLEADPARRYPSAMALRDAIAQPPAVPAARIVVSAVALIVVTAASSLFARSFFVTPIPAERHVAILPFRQAPGQPFETSSLEGGAEALSQNLAHCCTTNAAWFVPASEVRSLGPNAEAKARRAFGVNLILTGVVAKKSGRVSIDLTVTDAVSLRPLRSGTVQMQATELAAAEDELAQKAIGLLELAQATGRKTRVESSNPGALQYRQLALSYFNRRDTEASAAAISLLQKSITADVRYGLAYADLARALIQRYQLTKDTSLLGQAEQSLKTAQHLDGDGPSTLTARAQLAYLRGDIAGAIQLLHRSLALDPGDVDALVALASYYDKAGRTLLAERTYLKAVEAHRGDWKAYGSMGRFYFGHKQNVEAERYFRTACDLAPDSAQATSNLGGLLLYLGKYYEALAILQHGIDIKPSAAGYSNLGTAFFLDGQIEKSVQAFQHAASAAPADHRFQRNLGDGYLQLGNAKAAHAAYERALELVGQQIQSEPGNVALLGSRALYLAKCQRAAAAQQQVASAVYIHPDDRDLLFRSAVALELCGNRSGSLQLLKKAFAKGLSPEEVRTTVELGQLRKDPRFSLLLPEAEIN